ncbi:multifunctional protein ADE2 isoform X2 [Polypterus senegalus]|nr:multifunctional protein ADE2 isoform X2 [Polypterus senegalus]
MSTTSEDPIISPTKTKVKTSEKDFKFSATQKPLCDQVKPPFIPSVATEGGKHWTDDEVRALLYVWSDSNIQGQLEGAVRNKGIFEEIANKLQKFGVDRDWKQCRTKYKNLKYEYKTVRSAQGSGNAWKSMKFFNEIDVILRHKSTKARNNNELGKETVSEEENLTGLDEDDSFSTASEDLNNAYIKKEPQFEDDDSASIASEDPVPPLHWKTMTDRGDHISADDKFNQFRVITVNDTGIGRHWSDDEVKALILIWSDENIRQQLEGATRNKEIFEQIANRLMEIGIDRDWKQCRTKYKNLKYEYRALQRGNNQLCNPRRSMRFYDEVDDILKQSSSHQRKESESLPQPTNLNGKNSDETDTPKSTHSAEQHNTDENEYTNKVEELVVLGTKRKAKKEESPSSSKKRVHAAQPIECLVDSQTLSKSNPCKQEEEGLCIPTTKTITHTSNQSACQLTQVQRLTEEMDPAHELKLGKKLSEGKTKEIYELPDCQGLVLVQSKDQITAGNAARKDQMEGKAAISNKTTSCVFKLLQESGIKTAFIRQHSDTAFVAAHCEMIPIEWVCRRIATGSFLKRCPGVKEGYRFTPLKVETFFKDDANNDPQWSEEQLIEANFCLGGLKIGRCEVDIMTRTTMAIFEILERAWETQDCTLVDMKIEFGVNKMTKEIILADVIDNDSWRLWPSGDRSQQKDKQVYRDLKEVTPEAMQMVKKNFEWVAERVQLLLESKNPERVVVLMGSTSDIAHSEKIKKACVGYGIRCALRVTSAHKGPDETMRIKAEYEGDGVPTVFVAVAGRSNGLGPVLAGNTAFPVINCPPVSPDWGAQDIWSSLRMPSGLGCTTVLSPEAAAQFAAQIFGLNNHLVWAKLKASMLNTWVALKVADQKLQECSL